MVRLVVEATSIWFEKWGDRGSWFKNYGFM